MPEANQLPPWRYSDAKKQLIKDILDGTTDGKKPKEVHESRPEFKERKLSSFRGYLYTLRKALQEQKGRADADKAAFLHDEALKLRENNKPYPCWGGSVAERKLKIDIDAGKHKTMKPRQLQATRPQYAPYPPKVFKDHIQQEIRSRCERSYWMARRAELEAKKKKKEQAK